MLTENIQNRSSNQVLKRLVGARLHFLAILLALSQVSLASDAGIAGILAPTGQVCGGACISGLVLLHNYGSDTLFSVTINYGTNGITPSSIVWGGSLPPGASENVALPEYPALTGAHTYNANTQLPNGAADGNALNDAGSGPFTIINLGSMVRLEVTLDCWGSETGWEVVQGATVIESVAPGTYADVSPDGYSVVEEFCLADGCYDLDIEDTYGDGMNGSIWPGCNVDGDIKMYDEGGNLLLSLASPAFGNSDSYPFCVTSSLFSGMEVADTVVCQGSKVDFTNASGGNPSEWNWTFFGAIPATSADENPANIVYSGLGTYDVQLIVGKCGDYDTLLLQDYIHVLNVAPTIEPVVADADCHAGNGSATINISGGLAPYMTDWGGYNPLALPAGTYTVVVSDANDCIADSTVIVTQPAAALSASVGITLNASCGASDGSASLFISGGTPGYSEDWGTANPAALPAGIHAYTVTDTNGCETSGTAIVHSSNPPNVIATDTEELCRTICDGTLSATASAGSGSGYTYVWDNGIGAGANHTNVCPGDYVVTVTDGAGCINWDTTTVEIGLSAPNTNFFPVPAIAGINATVLFVNLTGGATTYTWDFGDGGSATTNSPSHVFAAVGVYNVSLTCYNANGCADVFVTQVTVIDDTSIDEFTKTGNVKVYPNPGKEKFQISLTASISNMQVNVFNSAGIQMDARLEKLDETHYNFHLPSASPGIYIVHVSGTEGALTRRITVIN